MRVDSLVSEQKEINVKVGASKDLLLQTKLLLG